LTSFTGTLTVGVVGLGNNGLLPMVTVYNSQGQALPSSVVENESGTFTVQLSNQKTSTTYYLQVSAANPSGANATGQYALWSDLSLIAPTAFTPLTTGTLTSSTNTSYSQLSINDTRLIRFALSASEAVPGTTEAVRMTIFDQNGNTVLTRAVYAGSPLVTDTVWLAAGNYTVFFNAAATSGSTLSPLTYTLSDLDLTQPVDPYPSDPSNPSSPPPPSPPPDPVVVVVSPPSSTAPSGSTVGSMSSPLSGS
jgi:hypothetical protein